MQKNIRTLPLRVEPGTVFNTETDHVLEGSEHSVPLQTGGKFIVPPSFAKVTASENLGPILLDRYFIRTDGDELWPIYVKIHSPTSTKTVLLRDPVINVLNRDNTDTMFLPDALIQFASDEAGLANGDMNFLLECMRDSGKLESEETCNATSFDAAAFRRIANGWQNDVAEIPLFMFNSSHPVEDQILQFKATDFGGIYDSMAYDGFTRLCLDEVLLTPQCLKQFGRCGIPKEVHLPPIPFTVDPKKIEVKMTLDDVLQKLVVWVNNLQFYEAILEYTLPIGDEDGQLFIRWGTKRHTSQIISGDIDIRLEEILTPWIGKVKKVWLAKTRNEELFLLLETTDGKQVVWYIDLVLATLLSQSVVRF